MRLVLHEAGVETFTHSAPLTNVLLSAELQLLAFHLLNLLVVELVPVACPSVLHVGDVVARIGTDATMDQNRTQFINTLVVWKNSPSKDAQISIRLLFNESSKKTVSAVLWDTMWYI